MKLNTFSFIGVSLLAIAGCDTHGSVTWLAESNDLDEQSMVTAVITSPKKGSIVSDHRAQVEGYVADLPESDDLVIMVVDTYGMHFLQWPPCRRSDDGIFTHRNVRIEIAADADEIERQFEILLIQASPEAVRSLQSAVNLGDWSGWLKLPDGTKILDSVQIEKK